MRVVTELLTEGDQVALVTARSYCRTGELKTLRLHLGLSRDEVARILGCTNRQEVWRWEETGTTPQTDRAIALGNLILQWLVIDQRSVPEALIDV
jgi:DNA-binding transcriptional regulator YiaG